MDKTLLFIVNPRAGKTKSSAPLFDAVATFGKAGYLVKKPARGALLSRHRT